MMHHNPIKSSNLAAVGYDLSRQVLGVTFKGGGKFEYPAVTPDQYAAMMKAESIGSHFSTQIRSRKKHSGVAIK